jgi:CBS domain-containing protein
MGDRILPIMRTMIEKSYTYVPILVDGRVAGVFSANTLLARVIDEGIGFDEDDTFAEIEDLLSLDAYDSEAFEFVSVDTSATEIIDLFETLPNSTKRLGAVFVTNNGDRNQRLLGMITAWDVASM